MSELRRKLERLKTYMEVDLEAPVNTIDTNACEQWNSGATQGWEDAYKDLLTKINHILEDE